jgi:hypothetical protein
VTVFKGSRIAWGGGGGKGYAGKCFHFVTKQPCGRAIAQAVSRWLPTAAVRGSKPDMIMWDLWWDKVALGQVFSEFFGFPCNRRSLQLLHNHPHISSGECTIGQCGRSAGTYRHLGDLKQRDLRNLNLGSLKKGPNGGVSPPPQKKQPCPQSLLFYLVQGLLIP